MSKEIYKKLYQEDFKRKPFSKAATSMTAITRQF